MKNLNAISSMLVDQHILFHNIQSTNCSYILYVYILLFLFLKQLYHYKWRCSLKNLKTFKSLCGLHDISVGHIGPQMFFTFFVQWRTILKNSQIGITAFPLINLIKCWPLQHGTLQFLTVNEFIFHLIISFKKLISFFLRKLDIFLYRKKQIAEGILTRVIHHVVFK